MSEKPIVHKFGGSCLRDHDDLDRIAEVLSHFDGPAMVVVSALWGTTDRLMRAAHEPRYAGRLVHDLETQHLKFAPGLENSQLSSLFRAVLAGIERSLVELARAPDDHIAINRLLAAGERLSALVVAHHLTKRGFDSHPVGSEDIGLKLSGSGKAQSVNLSETRNSLDLSALWGTPVITGWFGEGIDGELAILGRGGSDHTATAIANIVDAKKVILWKDVAGVLPLNPRWGIESSAIPYLGYGEAMELSRLDTPVLHPATVEPLAEIGIPLEIRQLYSEITDYAPTTIGPNILEECKIKGIGCLQSVASITAESSSLEIQSRHLGEFLLELNEAEVSCWDLESQPSELTLVVSQHDLELAKDIALRHFSDISVDYHSAIISLVGTSLDNDNERFISKLNSLEEQGQDGVITSMTLLKSGPYSIRFLVNTDNIPALLAKLAENFSVSELVN